MSWASVWLVLFLPILGLQIYGVVHENRAQLSRTVWRLLAAPWFRIPFMALWAWLTWHWIVEWLWLPSFRGMVTDDVLVVVMGALVGWIEEPATEAATDDEENDT